MAGGGFEETSEKWRFLEREKNGVPKQAGVSLMVVFKFRNSGSFWLVGRLSRRCSSAFCSRSCTFSAQCVERGRLEEDGERRTFLAEETKGLGWKLKET